MNEIVIAFGAGLAGGGGACGILWKIVMGRLKRAERDADACGKALRECIAARARFEAKSEMLEQRIAALENGGVVQ